MSRGEGKRAGKSERLSVYFAEAWQSDNLNKALELDGCTTDQQRSERRGYYLSLAAAAILDHARQRSTPPDADLNLLLLSPPEDVAQELRNEGFTDSKQVTLPLTAEVTEDEPQHKVGAW